MAEYTEQRGSTQEAAGAAPSPAELLQAALEKIVFFEWRLGELAADLAAAQSRAGAATQERILAEEQARAAQQSAQAARLALAELEAERARMATLLARPAHAAQGDGPSALSLEAERARSARLTAERDEALHEVDRQRAERERWLSEMIQQARAGGESPAALAEFISELRGEVIALRERQKLSDELLTRANLTLPPPLHLPTPPRAQREPQPVEAARALWAEGRLGGAAASRERSQANAALTFQPREGTAARALAEQCLRGLQAPEAARRAQAASHLSSVPSGAAAPLLAHALGVETDPRAKAALVRALVACGGASAADLALGLLDPSEPALVRLAAVEALASLGGESARTALEAGARDPSPAVRRRTAALLLDSSAPGASLLLSQLGQDDDGSVRSSSAPREQPAAAVSAAPPPRDLDAEVMHACRAAIFGLTEPELASALSLGEPDVAPIVHRLSTAGRLARRGKRLVAAGQAEGREGRP